MEKGEAGGMIEKEIEREMEVKADALKKQPTENFLRDRDGKKIDHIIMKGPVPKPKFNPGVTLPKRSIPPPLHENTDDSEHVIQKDRTPQDWAELFNRTRGPSDQEMARLKHHFEHPAIFLFKQNAKLIGGMLLAVGVGIGVWYLWSRTGAPAIPVSQDLISDE